MKGILETLAAPFTFALVPHDWGRFHGQVPVFGFLYTATMPAALFVSKRARIFVLYMVISIGIAFWYWTLHQDRYLQVYVPWMAAAVAAIASQAWQAGILARSGLVALIGAQLIVGAGVPFLPTHAMTSRSPLVTSLELMGKWRSAGRVDFESPIPHYAALAQDLPEGSKVLVHDDHLILGIGRPVVNDGIGWQLGIDYGTSGATQPDVGAIAVARCNPCHLGARS